MSCIIGQERRNTFVVTILDFTSLFTSFFIYIYIYKVIQTFFLTRLQAKKVRVVNF